MKIDTDVKRAAFQIHQILSGIPQDKHQLVNMVLRSFTLGSEPGLVIDGVEFREVTEVAPEENTVDTETIPVVESTPDDGEVNTDPASPDEVLAG